MNDHELTVHIKISRRTFVWGTAALLMCCAANEVGSESLTMTTYYPAPSGTYLGLTTTGGASASPRDTILARDAGKVGIGTASPNAVLDINSTTSGILLPRMTQAQRNAIPAPSAGSILYDTSDNQFEFWNGTGWASVASGIHSCLTRSTVGAGTVSCPAGYWAVGGGIDFSGMGDHGGYYSYPSSATSWTCGIDYTKYCCTGTIGVKGCYVQCCQ